MECFHACEQTGGKNHVQKHAPFISTKLDKAWLGEGYYFWLEREELAKIWGAHSVKGNYAIVKATLTGFDEQSDFLDLIGSPRAIAYFKDLYEKFEACLQAGREDSKPTVSACINYYRKLEKERSGVFPFKLIRAADQNDSIERSIRFIEGDERLHTIALNDRQQVCVFDEGKKYITDKKVVYPSAWAV